jgi:ketosteroid isomerase-like protein
MGGSVAGLAGASRHTACAMSDENVRVVRGATEAMISGDAEAALDALDPEIEWHGTVGGIDEGRIAHGREEVAQAFADYFEVWERIELRADDFIDAGGDEVIVFFHEVAKGRESGVVVETDTGTINTVRDGRIARVRGYMERSQALEAAGLEPRREGA